MSGTRHLNDDVGVLMRLQSTYSVSLVLSRFSK